VFAAEYEDATYEYREGDSERAPVSQLLPTGDLANRIYIVGTLSEVEDVGNDNEFWRARIVDPTGTFFLYAGEYAPAELVNQLRSVEPPVYVALTAKTDRFGDEEDGYRSSLKGEQLNVIGQGDKADADLHRDRWIAETIDATISRIEAAEDATDDIDDSMSVDDLLDAGRYVDAARAAYGGDPGDYRDVVNDAADDIGN
jgi:hypothetical protein